jgi:HEAT repeat protein
MDDERDLVQLLATDRRLEAMRGLLGGVGSRELRHVRIGDAAFTALAEGLGDPSPRVRWWCIQLLDHVPDPRALAAIAPLLDDPVPRVRRNAAHALGCVACKPDLGGGLPGDVLDRLALAAHTDPNAKVRAEARHALACRGA